MSLSVLALDIGGANLKATHSQGNSRLQPFALWKDPAGLPAALSALVQTFPPFDLLAVTMTGELCDCFETKREGVFTILNAVESAAGEHPIRVWLTEGRLVTIAEARSAPLKAAAANWLALATYAGRFAPTGPGLLIDIGSTTTDLIPLFKGRPIPQGWTDQERLRSRELVYTGVRRTPACALLGAEAAAELFATTLDVYLLLGSLPEDAADRNTADGRPATRTMAHARLARMVCADGETCTPTETQRLATRVLQRQVYFLQSALQAVVTRLPSPLQTIVAAGSGEFLIRTLLQSDQTMAAIPVLSLADKLGPEHSQAACAYALMTLAREQRHG